MKLQYKLLLILILFLGMVVLSDSKCLAVTKDDYMDYLDERIKKYYLTDEYDSYFIYSPSGYHSQNHSAKVGIVLYSSKNTFCFFDYVNDPYSAWYWFKICSNVSLGDIKFKYAEFTYQYTYYPDLWDIEFSTITCSTSDCKYCLTIPARNSFGYVRLNELSFKTNQSSIYKGFSNYSTDSTYYTNDMTFLNELMYDNVDKLNLYELNLTDLDYNNQTHQFNIATYTNSPCYNEIMEYYNKDLPYCIYITDYQRILTYGKPDNDDSFQYGSYTLSGYIDYLTSDTAFWYFDPRSQSIKSNSGRLRDLDLQLFTDEEDYTKRFYFKMVYSEDSNDPHATIWDTNGNLFSTDFDSSIKPIAFVGGSHSIHYAHYKSFLGAFETNFIQLDNDYYYVGYFGENVHREIESKPYYRYDFNFTGGTTKLFFLNSTTYENDIANAYNEWNEQYAKDEIVPDSSGGGSVLEGVDPSTSTYDIGEINKDSTQQELEENSGNMRGFEETNAPETSADSAHGSISKTIKDILNKFAFKDNIINNANEIKDFIANTQETHKYYLTIHSKYLSGNVCIIDLSWYAPYKPTVDAFICAFAYLAFIWHMFCKIPDLIRGVGASSYVSEIHNYTTTGAGRSSNIHKGGF